MDGDDCVLNGFVWKHGENWNRVCGTPFLSQIWRGLLPMLYKMERNPDWNVFLNIAVDNLAGKVLSTMP